MAFAIASFALISPALARDPTVSPRCVRDACGASALLADAANNATFPLSSAFSVSEAPALRRTCRERELKAVARADARERYRERVEMQMERYRAEPVFGLLENKLLAKRALAASVSLETLPQQVYDSYWGRGGLTETDFYTPLNSLQLADVRRLVHPLHACAQGVHHVEHEPEVH